MGCKWRIKNLDKNKLRQESNKERLNYSIGDFNEDLILASQKFNQLDIKTKTISIERGSTFSLETTSFLLLRQQN